MLKGTRSVLADGNIGANAGRYQSVREICSPGDLKRERGMQAALSTWPTLPASVWMLAASATAMQCGTTVPVVRNLRGTIQCLLRWQRCSPAHDCRATPQESVLTLRKDLRSNNSRRMGLLTHELIVLIARVPLEIKGAASLRVGRPMLHSDSY